MLGGAAPAAAAEAPVEEQTDFDVKLESFEAAAKIKVIKEIRSLSELGLKEAKELVSFLSWELPSMQALCLKTYRNFSITCSAWLFKCQ